MGLGGKLVIDVEDGPANVVVDGEEHFEVAFRELRVEVEYFGKVDEADLLDVDVGVAVEDLVDDGE